MKKSEEGEESGPDIPPPQKVSRPVLKNIPPSLPVWQDIASRGNFDRYGISTERRKIIDVEDEVPLTSYIVDKPIDYVGEIREVEVGSSIASAYQYVYVSLKEGHGQIGDTYLVVSNRGSVQNVSPTISGYLGYSVEVQGELQIVEQVESVNRSVDRDMYRALVLNIINPVSIGSVLIKGNIEKIKLTQDGPRSSVVAQIIGGAFFNRRQVYGTESITYLNRGELDGLKIGQILPIRANRQVRNEYTEIASNIRPIGWIRIVKTTPNFSTGIIVKAWSDILSGDLTGTGGLLPQMAKSQDADSDEPEVEPKKTSLKSEFDEDNQDTTDDFGEDFSE
ncbi:MAG: hypothetical protein A2Z20_03025 [Bdellovibrionales bacterium RBG_16_40_8]|nr:MAG: hypothetical protein A2Z20_03025 [Bdellovibrionales bacterium RBG_16_40_8]